MKELKEFEKWLDKARKEEDEQLPFVWGFMKNPFVAYHYSLLKDKTLGEEFRRNLRNRFDEHHEQGHINGSYLAAFAQNRHIAVKCTQEWLKCT